MDIIHTLQDNHATKHRIEKLRNTVQRKIPMNLTQKGNKIIIKDGWMGVWVEERVRWECGQGSAVRKEGVGEGYVWEQQLMDICGSSWRPGMEEVQGVYGGDPRWDSYQQGVWGLKWPPPVAQQEIQCRYWDIKLPTKASSQNFPCIQIYRN